MRSGWRSTKVRIQRHILTVFNVYCLHNPSIPSDFVKCFTEKNYKTWESAQHLIYHSDLPSQIASLKKTIDKGIFFCFPATCRTSREDTRTSRCCWWHKFATKALLCNTQYFYTVDSDVYFSNAQGMHCCLATATMVTPTHHNNTLSVNWPSLMANGIIMKRQSKFHLSFRIPSNSLSLNCHKILRFLACNFTYSSHWSKFGKWADRGKWPSNIVST